MLRVDSKMTWAFVLYSFKPLAFGEPMTYMISGTGEDMSSFPEDLKDKLYTFYDYVYYVECDKRKCPIYLNHDQPTPMMMVHLGKKNKLEWGVQLRKELKKIRSKV